MKTGLCLVEYLVYIVLALIILLGTMTFVVRMIAMQKKFERTILANAAVHNVISLLRQDAARMPCQRQMYMQLAEHDFSCTTSTAEIIRWYFVDNSLKRASRVDGAWDYAVVLEPIQQCSFDYQLTAIAVQAVTIDLVHNGASISYTLWLRSYRVTS